MEIDFKKHVKNGNFLDIADKKWISSDNVKKLGLFLKSNPGIKALNLKNCYIHIDKLELLIAPIKNSKISNLDISSNQLGDVGAAKIAELSNLTTLDISYSQLGDVGAAKIAELKKITKLCLKGNPKISYSGIEKLAVIKNTDIIISNSGEIQDLFLKFLQCGNITSEKVKNIVFKIAAKDNSSPLIQHIINSPKKYHFAINSLDNDEHSLWHFYNHNPEMQQFLFQHGAVPNTEQKQDRLKTLAQDSQSVHTTEAVKLVNFITDNLFKVYGNIENKQQLLAKAEAYQAELTKLGQVYQNSMKLKLLSLSDGAKRDTMKKTLVANQFLPKDPDYVATVIDTANRALTTIYLAKINGQYNPGYPTHEMEYGDGHKITIPQSLGLVKSLIDTMEIPVAEKLELLVTLMRQNLELVESKLEIIQDKLNIDVPPKILVDSTRCHKFLATNPIIKNNHQTIGDLFNIISGLDIEETWREQKAFTVAEAIYIAATTYNADRSACIQGVRTHIVNSAAEVDSTLLKEYYERLEEESRKEKARDSITETNIQEFIGVLAKNLLDSFKGNPELQETLAEFGSGWVDISKPSEITREQQKILVEINKVFTKTIQKLLPHYIKIMPGFEEYKIIITELAENNDMRKFAKDYYNLQEPALQLEDDISAHSLVEGYQQPFDNQDVVEIIGGTEGQQL